VKLVIVYVAHGVCLVFRIALFHGGFDIVIVLPVAVAALVAGGSPTRARAMQARSKATGARRRRKGKSKIMAQACSRMHSF
jgi:hypothetical protein